jgi:hypothetical protein
MPGMGPRAKMLVLCVLLILPLAASCREAVGGQKSVQFR